MDSQVVHEQHYRLGGKEIPAVTECIFQYILVDSRCRSHSLCQDLVREEPVQIWIGQGYDKQLVLLAHPMSPVMFENI